jgi:hypothetical protein
MVVVVAAVPTSMSTCDAVCHTESAARQLGVDGKQAYNRLGERFSLLSSTGDRSPP